MSEQLPDKRFERLATLVGDILAKRWMKILAKHQNSNVSSRGLTHGKEETKKPRKDMLPDCPRPRELSPQLPNQDLHCQPGAR